jgi:6,7-dimethyl-8-ribityllumazine synthase
MAKVLLIKAEENKNIMELIEHGAVSTLDSLKIVYDTIIVPSIIEIPSAISFAIDSSDYEGVVCIGCIKEDANSAMELAIYSEVLRAINEFAVHYVIPVGIGVGIFTKKDKVAEKAPELGKKAANAVVHMVKLKRHFTVLEEDRYSIGQKHN